MGDQEEDVAVALPPPSEADVAKAEELKGQGNAQLKESEFTRAIESYTKAIELNPTNAVYFANRAFVHIKLEEHGSAIEDATKAIELNPRYAKGYYRRADAYLALAKFKPALKDFKKAVRLAPKDADLKRKITETEKAVQRAAFEKALAGPDEVIVLVSDSIVLEDIVVESGYSGARMDTDDDGAFVVTQPFVTALVESFKGQGKLHRRFAFEILLAFQRLVKVQPSLVDIEVPVDTRITVCGDTHGQYYDLLHIFDLNGLPSAENPYLFNGDFVDRGSFSLEVILTLMAFKCLEPSCMHLSRGNHEARSLNKIYGFEGEVKAKFNLQMMEVFRETFCWLPLGFRLAEKVLVLHGGLFSRDDVTLDELRQIDRFREPPDEGLMCEMLWSDPQPEPGRAPSKRGCGLQFGPDVTKDFLQRNGLELIVRSHEVKDGGYEVQHDGYLITVFSAPNYCDNMANKGAYIHFNGADMVPHFNTFTAVPHPDVKPMAYANMGLYGGIV